MAQTVQKMKIKKPAKEGYLDKQSSFWKTYRKRWMVLQGHILYSFKEEKVYENPTEIFDLRIYNKCHKSADGKTGQFELTSPNDSRIFLASSQNEMKDWIKYIKKCSKNAKNVPKKRGSTGKINTSASAKKSVPSKKKSTKKKNGATSVTASRKKNNSSSTTSTKKKKKNKNSPSLKNTSSLKVTNSSMDRHIERMNLAKAKSHEHPHTGKKSNKSNKTSTKKKSMKQKKISPALQRQSVPNVLNHGYHNKVTVNMTKQKSQEDSRHKHVKSTSNLLMDPSLVGTRDRRNAENDNTDDKPHRRSVSSMFGGFGRKKKQPSLESSSTDQAKLSWDGDEDAQYREFNIRSMQQTSQSERNLFHKSGHDRTQSANLKPQTPKTNYSHPMMPQLVDTYYSVTFETKPFGLTLNPFEENKQIGAIVMVNHNVNDQIIKQGSRFVSINNDPCKNFKFERIKNMCRNATLPTTIKFLHSGLPEAMKLNTNPSVVSPANIIKFGNQSPVKASVVTKSKRQSSPKHKKQNKRPSPRGSPRGSPRNSPRNGNTPSHSPQNSANNIIDKSTADKIFDEPKPAKKVKKIVKKRVIKKKKQAKPKQSLEAKQNRERKSALELMKSLSGMKQIKKAESFERQRKWKDCINNYEKGIEELEKSLKSLQVANILTNYQQKECQHQIDLYCRTLIKLQREHSKEIMKEELFAMEKKKASLTERLGKKSDDNRVRSGSLKKNAQIHNRARSALPKKNNPRSAFNKSQKSKTKFSEYAINEDEEETEENVFKPKKRESAVSQKRKEMARMKREMKTGKVENPNGSDDDDKKEDENKKEEDEKDDIYAFLNRDDPPKKEKKKEPKKRKSKSANKKKSKKENNKKKGGKKKKKNSKEDDDDDDNKEDEDGKKKKSKLSKQDQEFRSRLEADIVDEAPDVSFKDVQGLANVKLALYETIILPALRPELFTGLRTPTSGLLLFGPPGNGKTMIAKCVAAQCDATFFSISASSITSKFVGDAERIMRTLFNLAREKSPSIIFIDEIDSMLTARGGKNEAESSRKIKTEFLIQFDGVKKASETEKRMLVIGATNLPDQLDEAVLRRFGKRIMVPLPDQDTRSGILRLLMSKQKTELKDNDYINITKQTDGYSCSDLATLCKDAAMGPIRALGAKILEIKDNADMPPIKYSHFENSVKSVRASLPQSSLKYFMEWNDKFGSKIHLSMSALPENMRPYTMEELAEIDRKREEKEEAEKQKRLKQEEENASDHDDESDSE